VTGRRVLRWSEVRELVRPHRPAGDATDRRLAAAATRTLQLLGVPSVAELTRPGPVAVGPRIADATWGS